MYLNPPPEVDALATMLQASATFAALGCTVCYPSASTGDSASPTTAPFVVLEPVEKSPRTIAPGIVLPGGKIQGVLTMRSDSGADIELKAHAIADEIQQILDGLPILSVTVGMASEPDPGDRAAQEYLDENVVNRTAALRTISLVFSYGIST